MRSEKERSGSLPSSISLVIGLTNFGFWGGRGRCCVFDRSPVALRLRAWAAGVPSAGAAGRPLAPVARRGRWASRFAARFGRLFRARLDRGQRHATPLFVDVDDPHGQHIAHAHHLVRIAHEPIGQATDVDQAAVGQPNVHKRPEIDNVQHGAGQLHAGLRDLPA